MFQATNQISRRWPQIHPLGLSVSRGTHMLQGRGHVGVPATEP